MKISTRLEQLHSRIKGNRWFRYFTVFNRVALAAGFLHSGFVKIMGERFTALSVNHPMGHYLEALHHTGYYYTFIGVVQMLAAILLLIPRTATFGAVLYFPVILNICILSFAVRFDGSLVSAPLMVISNLYLLLWDYDKLKYILPFHKPGPDVRIKPEVSSNKFPFAFFAGAAVALVVLVFSIINAYEIRPCNSPKDCMGQCEDSPDPQACIDFCDCIHKEGQPLDKCLEEYNKALQETDRVK